jgi:hypothetical protein
MSENPLMSDQSVDRREETMVTQQPGYAATEQVTRDVAAERRLRLALATQIIWTILAGLEILLGLRLMLKFITANPDSGFAVFVYGFSQLFLAPFTGLVGNPQFGGAIFEVTTVIAMVVYALLTWGIVSVVQLAASRPIARTSMRSTREQTPGGIGSERTTHTTRSG